jgi:hypothetical protein
MSKPDKRTIVQLYKFEKLPNIRGRGKEYKVTNNLTGEIVEERTRDASGKLKEIGRVLYYADTKTKVLDECIVSSEDEDERPFKESTSSSASVASSASEASKQTVSTVKKTLMREFNWHQKYDIFNQVLYGHNSNKEGEIIDVAQRSKYRNVGPFYTSVCAVLNDGKSYPSFAGSKAVATTVKSHVDTEVAAHKQKLVTKFGEKFIEHDSFMQYSCHSGSSSSDEADELKGDEFYKQQVLMFLDALVFADENKEEESGGEPRHSESQEKGLQEKKIDGKERNPKRARVDKVKPKPIDHVAQLHEQQNGLTGLINSIVSMASEGPRPAAAESVDPGVLAIKNSLTALTAPPGLPPICQKLAEGLAGYGFCTLQELLTMRDSNYKSASGILEGLHWSPLQVTRVLGDAPA